MVSLRRVEPPLRLSWFARSYSRMAATRPAKWVSRHLNWKLDPWLLRVTGGRFASTLVFPTALLETRGARSGQLRRNPVIYFHDGDRITIVASNAGDEHHPAWFHNLVADPEVVLGGEPMQAVVVVDESECERLWALADRVFPAFGRYRADASRVHRTIPIVQLAPRP